MSNFIIQDLEGSSVANVPVQFTETTVTLPTADVDFQNQISTDKANSLFLFYSDWTEYSTDPDADDLTDVMASDLKYATNNGGWNASYVTSLDNRKRIMAYLIQDIFGAAVNINVTDIFSNEKAIDNSIALGFTTTCPVSQFGKLSMDKQGPLTGVTNAEFINPNYNKSAAISAVAQSAESLSDATKKSVSQILLEQAARDAKTSTVGSAASMVLRRQFEAVPHLDKADFIGGVIGGTLQSKYLGTIPTLSVNNNNNKIRYYANRQLQVADNLLADSAKQGPVLAGLGVPNLNRSGFLTNAASISTRYGPNLPALNTVDPTLNKIRYYSSYADMQAEVSLTDATMSTLNILSDTAVKLQYVAVSVNGGSTYVRSQLTSVAADLHFVSLSVDAGSSYVDLRSTGNYSATEYGLPDNWRTFQFVHGDSMQFMLKLTSPSSQLPTWAKTYSATDAGSRVTTYKVTLEVNDNTDSNMDAFAQSLSVLPTSVVDAGHPAAVIRN